jgi:hypothetical protein
MEFHKKVDFADNIVCDSSLEDIEIFIKKLIQQFHIKLMDSGIETISKATLQLSHSPIEIIVTNKHYRSRANHNGIYIYLGWNVLRNRFPEYKRFAKNKVIGSLEFITFQDYVMAVVAHEYAHFVNLNMDLRYKPHGKEFQQIYVILRQHTNGFLPKDAIIGECSIADDERKEYWKRLIQTGNIYNIIRGDCDYASDFASSIDKPSIILFL